MDWFPRVPDEFNRRYAGRRVSVVTTPSLGPGYVPDSEGVCVCFHMSELAYCLRMELDNGCVYDLDFGDFPGPENQLTGRVKALLPNRRVFTFE